MRAHVSLLSTTHARRFPLGIRVLLCFFAMMNHQNTTTPAIIAPDSAVWFRIEQHTPEGWARTAPPGTKGGWAQVDEHPLPAQLAALLGPGAYRVHWAALDKRRGLGTTEPFRVMPAEEAPPQAPQPQPQPAPAPAAAPQPAPAAAPAMPMPVGDPTMMRFVFMYRLIRDDIKADNQTFLRLMSEQMGVALEAERNRSREVQALGAQYYEAADRSRAQLMQTSLAMQSTQGAGMQPVLAELADIRQRLDDDAAAEEVPFSAEEIAQLQQQNAPAWQQLVAALPQVIGAFKELQAQQAQQAPAVGPPQYDGAEAAE